MSDQSGAIEWKNFAIDRNFHPPMPTQSPPPVSPPPQNQWNPANVQVQNGDLVLSLQRNSPTIWNGQPVWAAAEAVVRKQLRYGTYCCTFRVEDQSGAAAWSQFDVGTSSNPNQSANTSTTFGIFIYDVNADGSANPQSEIDLLELGFQNQPNNGQGWIAGQPSGPKYNNAQFALQPWDAGNSGHPNWNMVRRINVDVSKVTATGNDVTVLCRWTGPNSPINFYLAYGKFTSATFPFTAHSTISYTTPNAAQTYVPALRPSMRLHLNLWPYGGPTTNKPVFCRVSNLEMPH